MHHTGRLPCRPHPKGTSELKVVERCFVFLCLDDVNLFAFHQLFGEQRGVPREALWWIVRREEASVDRSAESGVRAARKERGAILVGDAMNNQSALAFAL